MMHDTDILIVGGGLNGPALALALAGSGLRITVIDALPRADRAQEGFDGRSYALALASKRVLDVIGVWQDVAGQAQPILAIKASDGRPGEGAGPFFLDFDAAELDEGPMGYMLEDRFLRPALLAAMDTHPAITQIDGARVVAQVVTGNGVSITLNDGRLLIGRLLIGCDGRDSPTAQRAGIRRTGWDYGQTGLVCAIAHELPHNGCAHQFFMPAGPLAILPLPGNRSSIVWTERTEDAARIHTLPDAAYLDVLRPRFGDFLGAITLAGKRFAYPLRLTIANSFIAPRLALVGDAAHGMHPIAGQGFNFGLRDVAALAEVLTHAQRRGEDIASPLVLERYQHWRRFDTMTMAVGTDSVNRLFSNDNPLFRGLRGLGMGAVSAVPSLRTGFMRAAAGLSGDTPRLMRGLAL
ncbi:MAG: FAD-dependent monooxygenase [Roseinatronobacter sp.]